MPSTFKFRLRVRLAETDAKGVVYYGQYFVYFDVARLELFRKLSLKPEELISRSMKFAVAEASCSYHSSARFDDLLEMNVRVERIGRTSITFLHRVKSVKDGANIASGRVVDVLIDSRGKPIPLPAVVRERLKGYVHGPSRKTGV
jgi:acyl-CoA thioester hydrolase